MSSANATWPRAWPTEVLKNSVPASAIATKASPIPPAAVSSIRFDSPVRPAPEAPLMRCTKREAPPAAAALARPARCEAAYTDRPARLARSVVPVSPMAQVFCLGEPAQHRRRLTAALAVSTVLSLRRKRSPEQVRIGDDSGEPCDDGPAAGSLRCLNRTILSKGTISQREPYSYTRRCSRRGLRRGDRPGTRCRRGAGGRGQRR